MNRDLLHILSDNNKDIDNRLLVDYLDGKLNREEQHLVEEWLTDNPFAADAIEGLQQYGSREELNATVGQLNKELRQYLQNRKARREKRRWKDNPLLYITVAVLLVLIVIAYYVVRMAVRQ